MVSIIIPTYNRSKSLNRLLNSIPKSSDLEIIVIGNNGLSLAQKRNLGIQKAKGKHLLFIDDDNVLEYGAIKNAVKIIQENNVGIVGMVACYSTNRHKVCDSGAHRNLKWSYTTDKFFNKYKLYMWDKTNGKPYEVDEVANAFMVRKSLFEKIGVFDEERFPIDLDEADLCIRAKRAGYKVVMSPGSIVYHNSINHTRIPTFRRPKNAYYMSRNRILFQKKHHLPLWFVPWFVVSYVIVLAFRGKFKLIYHFLKGAKDGLRDFKGNKEEYRS